MTMGSCKTAVILGVVGGGVMLGTAAVAVYRSKRMRTLRAVHKTNAMVRRVGMMLTRISEAADEVACGARCTRS